MTSNQHPYKHHLILAALYIACSNVLVCGLFDPSVSLLDNNLRSWHLLHTSKALQNATQNIVFSPNNLQQFIMPPLPINVRTEIEDRKTGKGGLILTASRKQLENCENLERFYGSVVLEIHLDNDMVVETINEWCSLNTDHKFPKIIESASEIAKLKVLILKVFHFNETLQVNFKYTAKAPFYLTTKNFIEVPSVETTDYFDYLDSHLLDAKVLRLPYSNNISMYVLVPHTKQGVNELLNNLSYRQLKRVQWMMERKRVNVLLPKFKYHYTYQFKPHVKGAIPNPFDIDNSDYKFFQIAFGDLVNETMISQISTLNFDGKGKEANSLLLQAKFEILHVDRPFVVYIEEDKTGDIKFIGKILNPTQIL